MNNDNSGAPECPNGFHPLRWEDSAEPFAKLEELRHQCPVSTIRFGALPPMTLVTRFKDISAVYLDPEHFGNIGVSVNAAEVESRPPQAREIIATDPPRHGAMRRFAEGANHAQPGDPSKFAGAILTLANAANPPQRLALGSDAVQRIADKHNLVESEVAAWKALSLSTDLEA